MHSCHELRDKIVSKGNHKNVAVWSTLVSGRLVRKQACSIVDS